MCCDFWKRWQTSPTDLPVIDSPHFQQRWSDYYEAVIDRPPRSTLIQALNSFATEAPPNPPRNPKYRVGFAVDLGCGNGRDTVELLRRNWRVLAIDGQTEAINQLRQRQDINRTYLETRVQRFESLTLPPSVDLINASFCLPFCPASYFADMWEEIVTAIRPGGRFCGQLFGDRDSWAVHPDITHHTLAQVKDFFAPFEIELLEEEEHPGKTPLGEERHWHLFHIVARKT
ncbi:MAG: class I SAM-dependent methyltransferase [Cyanobacteria bacterium J06639_14]